MRNHKTQEIDFCFPNIALYIFSPREHSLILEMVLKAEMSPETNGILIKGNLNAAGTPRISSDETVGL